MAVAAGDGSGGFNPDPPKAKSVAAEGGVIGSLLAALTAGSEATASAKPASKPAAPAPAPGSVSRLTPYTPAPEAPAAEDEGYGGVGSGEIAEAAVGGILGSGSIGQSLRNASATYSQLADKKAEEEKVAERGGKPKVRKSYEMTWDDYQALPDSKRAAIDFNTMLVDAREKDLNTDYEEHPELKATYEEAVTQMFGEDGGSATYAPETMAVLQQIDFKPIDGAKGDDLDDFLGLKVAITDKDLERLDVNAANFLERASNPMPAGLEVKQQLVTSTISLEESLAKGNQMLQDFRSSATEARNDTVGFFGGTRNEVELGPGFGNEARDEEFRAAFDVLINKGSELTSDDIGGLMSALRADGKEQDFLRFVETKATTAERYGLPLGEDSEIEYRSPEEFRVLLGLDEGD